MSRRLVVLVEDQPQAYSAVAWTVGVSQPGDLIVLASPWRRGQNEWDAASESVVDAPTAARLRLLIMLDRVRDLRPEARLHLMPLAGDPRSVVPVLSADADLLVLAGRAPRRFSRHGALGRARSLIASATCPVVVIRADNVTAVTALLVDPSGKRQEATPEQVHRLTRP